MSVAGDNVIAFPQLRTVARGHHADPARAACLHVAAIAAEACGATLGSVLAAGRGGRAAQAARQIAIYIACVDLELPQRLVGRILGRHRTTVLRAVQTVEDLRDDPAFDAALSALEERAATDCG
jgi:chromosomal replication initiation ATPase DnaA